MRTKRIALKTKHTDNTSSILVVGSVAFDVVFDLVSNIRDQINIVGGKVGKQNLMFTATGKEQFYGGTGANIAYGLGQLEANPILFSAAGRDFLTDYRRHLESVGVDNRVYVDNDGWTATYYGMTDRIGEQVGVWQPNSYGEHVERLSLVTTIELDELASIRFSIFAAGTPSSTLNHMAELRATSKDACIIFDPGQSLASLYTPTIFKKALNLADIFIANDVEILYAKKHLGLDVTRAVKKGKKIIETQGEKGSVIYEKTGKSHIRAFRPKKIVDTTGAGDAYRVGLIYGLATGRTLRDSCVTGALVASRCIECVGAQSYRINKEDIK